MAVNTSSSWIVDAGVQEDKLDNRPQVIAIAAFGTLGDVLPLARIAIRLVQQHVTVKCAVPLELKGTLWKALTYDAKYEIYPSPDAIQWTWIDVPTLVPRSKASHEDEEAFHSLFHKRDQFHNLESMLTKTPEVTFIVFNLFCLEAWHLGFASGIPSLACHPYLVPSTPRQDDYLQLVQKAPCLCKSLVANKDDCMTVGEFRFWTWPLLNVNRWEQMWYEYLIPQYKVDAPWNFFSLPSTMLIICGEPCLTVPEGHWPKSVRVTSYPRLQVDTLRSYPANSRDPICVSLGASRRCKNHEELVYQLIIFAVAFYHSDAWAIWMCEANCHEYNVWKSCLSYASLAGLIEDEFCSECIHTLEREPTDVGEYIQSLRILHGKIRKAAQRLNIAENLTKKPIGLVLLERVLPMPVYVPLEKILAHCRLLIHHGGSGTSITATWSGTPQAILPSFYDQTWWGERLSDLGVAEVIPAENVRPNSSIKNIDIGSALLPFQVSCVKQQATSITKLLDQLCTSYRSIDETMKEYSGDPTENIIMKVARNNPMLECERPRSFSHQQSRTTVCCCDHDWCCSRYRSPVVTNSAHTLLNFSGDCSLCTSAHVAFEGARTEAGRIIEENFLENVYFPPEFPCSKYLNSPKLTVIDVGANIGVFSTMVGHLRPNFTSTKVIAIEPIRENVDMLRANLQLHGMMPLTNSKTMESVFEENHFLFETQLYEALVWSEPGTKVIRHFMSVPGNSSCFPEEKEKALKECGHGAATKNFEDVSCSTMRLSSVLQTVSIDNPIVLKIDVEGSELEVLKSISREQLSAISYLCMEIHPPLCKVKAVLQHIIDCGQFTSTLLKCETHRNTHTLHSLVGDSATETSPSDSHCSCRNSGRGNWLFYASN